MGFDLYGERPTVKEGTVKPKEINWDTATQEEKEEQAQAPRRPRRGQDGHRSRDRGRRAAAISF